MDLKTRLQTGARKVRNYSRFIVLLSLTTLFAFIAAPKIEYSTGGERQVFTGIEPKMFNSNINVDFQLAKSTEFGGGTRAVYNITGISSNPSEFEIQSLLSEYETRLRKAGLSDYRIQIRKDIVTDGYELVAELPRYIDELTLINEIITFRGEVSFSTQSPVVEAEGVEQQPSLQPTELTEDYVQSYSIVYGATTSGYGLVVDFKDEFIPQMLVYAVSDINTSGSAGLILQVDGVPTAGQAVAYNTGAQDGKITFASNLGNDSAAANMLLHILNDDPIATTLSFSEDKSAQIPGEFDHIVNEIKLALAGAFTLLGLVLIGRYKKFGIIAAINIAFVIFASIAVLKIFNTPLLWATIAGLIFGVIVYLTISYKTLGLRSNAASISRSEAFAEIKQARSHSFNFLIISSLLLLVLNYSQIPTIVSLTNSFSAVLFFGWISLFIYPTLKLITDKE